jgi:DNA polymerase-3 subunit alpha
MQLKLEIETVDALRELAQALVPVADGGGEVLAKLHAGEGRFPEMRLGRSFLLDGDLVEGLAAVEGLSVVHFKPLGGRDNLKLVA